jgi:hypothetical protein
MNNSIPNTTQSNYSKLKNNYITQLKVSKPSLVGGKKTKMDEAAPEELEK